MGGNGGPETTSGFEISKKWSYVALALVLVYAFARSVVAAAGKPLWYDELLTKVVAAQGSWQRIVTALLGPTDGQPPLFYAIEHFASGLCTNQHIALRLPAAAGLVCTLWCVFVYARKRGGEAIALLCSGAMLTTCVFQYYAQEARPYSMVLALIAFAMVCYQRIERRNWPALLGVSLFLAQSLHYLAVLAMVPFGVAEVVETWKSKKIRWSVWAALAIGALPLAIFWKLLQLNKTYYGQHHFYANFPISAIPNLYAEFFGVSSFVGGAVGLTALAAICVAVAMPGSDGNRGKGARNAISGEAALLFAFAGLPFAAFLFSKATHSGMTARYVLATVLGIVLGLGYYGAKAGKRGILVAGVFIVAAIGISELHFWRFEATERAAVRDCGSTTEKFFAAAGYADLPVVAPNGGTLLASAYYAFPSASQRLVFLQEPRSPDDPDASDTTEKGLLQVRKYVPIQVVPAEEFLAKHERFLVYTEGVDVGKDRVTSKELKDGWSVRMVAFDGFRALHLVSRSVK